MLIKNVATFMTIGLVRGSDWVTVCQVTLIPKYIHAMTYFNSIQTGITCLDFMVRLSWIKCF